MSSIPPLESDAPPPRLTASGDLSQTAPDVVLRFCERVHFSGTLAFQNAQERGFLPMLNGIPEILPDDARLERALDEFLALTNGRYTLRQLLPVLEGARSDGDLVLRGSLESTLPADLLRYCERAGLTGSLTLNQGERTCVARYRYGELLSITVDNEGAADLGQVFAWAQGGFVVRAQSVFEGERVASGPQPVGFLKTLELALTEVLEKSERGAAAAHPSGARAPAPVPSILRSSTLPFGVEGATGTPRAIDPDGHTGDRRARTAPPVPQPPAGPESVVKVYFVDRAPLAQPSTTQHAVAHLGSEVIPLDPTTAKSRVVRVIEPATVNEDANAPRASNAGTGTGVSASAAVKASDGAGVSVNDGPGKAITDPVLTAVFASVLLIGALAWASILIGLLR